MDFKIIKIFVCLVLFLFLTPESSPQLFTPDFEKVIFNQSENIGTVYTIIKDKQGFIWLGTSTGLKRYDGVNLKSYRFDPLDSLSISSNEVRSIQEDKDGNLWIGTINKGINKFIRREEKFIRYDKGQKGNYFLKEETVPQLIYTKDDQLWACVWEAGLAYFDKDAGRFEYIIPDSNEISSTLSKHIRSIHQSETDPNIFYVGTRQGLMKFDRRSKKYFPLFEKDIASGSALSGFIFSIIEGKDNTLWIGSQNKGFCNFNPTTKKISQYGLNQNTSVLSLAKDEDANIWIGSAGDGIFYFDLKKKILTNFYKQENISGSLQSNVINSFFVCDEEIVWIGTAGAGLFRFASSNKKFTKLNPSKQTKGYNKDEYVSHIFEDDDKDIWICGGDGKIFIYNVNQDMVEPLFKERGVRPRSKIYSVISAGSNKYLIATFGEGFFLYDKISGRISQKKLYPEYSSLRYANKVTSFLKASQGKYYVGTDGAGLFEYDFNSDKIILHNDNMPNVWALFRDQLQNVWVGTWDSGLFRFNESIDEIESFYPSPNDTSLFTSTTTVCIFQDYRGNLWFGTQGDGIFLMEHDKIVNPVFKNFNSSNSIPGDLIMGIVAEDKDNIWISTQAGLSRYDYNTETFSSYGQQEGIEQLEFNLGSILKASDNNIYFGSLEGIYLTNNKKFINKQKAFNIVITGVKLFNNPIAFYNKNYPSTEYESLSLNYNENFLSFDFVPLNYLDPLKVTCEYMLEGVDDHWLNDEGRRFANYTDLPPGNYRFLVRSFDAENNLISVFASIDITIHPPVWATWYAYAFYGLLLISILLLFRKYELEKKSKKVKERLRRNKEEAEIKEMKLKAEAAELKAKTLEQQKEIEKQKIRNRIAQDLHDEIGSNLSSISLMSDLIQKTEKSDPDSINKINRIHKVAKDSSQAMRDIVWITNPNSDNLKDLITKMNEVANDMLSGIKYKFDFPQETIEIHLSPETKRNVFLIFKEALNNIIKHSDAGNAFIRLKINDKNLSLAIKDDGKGFNTASGFNGNGLKNMQNRAKEINGILKLNSYPSDGTTLALTVNITQMRD